MRKGLIIKAISGEYSVFVNGETFICKPRGVFRHKDLNPKVGDIVDISDDLQIYNIYERKNDLNRPVISNIDLAMLVFSVKEPDLNLELLDRMLVIMEYNDIEPIIVFSKMDLISVDDKINTIIGYYKEIGYKIYLTKKNEINHELIKEIKNKICVLTGQSGVGKSSLLNVIDPTLNIKTDVISNALGRGKHTTRHIELLHICDGWIADSPGFGSVSFEDIDLLTLSQSFKEFFNKSVNCKFSKCTHINEPNCEIKKLVEEKAILKSRYNNYLMFAKEVKENKKNMY